MSITGSGNVTCSDNRHADTLISARVRPVFSHATVISSWASLLFFAYDAIPRSNNGSRIVMNLVDGTDILGIFLQK